MRISEIFMGTGHTLVQGTDTDIKNLTIDSRYVRAGSLFFCIRGLSTDGHAYIAEAAGTGAAAVVVDRVQANYPAGLCVVKVDDVRKALAVCASNFYGRPAQDMPMAGITGTNGKTSTCFFVDAILGHWGKKVGTITTVKRLVGGKTVETHVATSTTPDTIELHNILREMRDEGAQYVAMEVTSHAIALEKVEGIVYDVAGFTNLTQDHLDFHKDFEDYRDTKKRLFHQCRNAVTNIDDSYGQYMVEGVGCDITTYSIDKPSDLQAKNVKMLQRGVEFELSLDGEDARFFLPIRGRFTVYNALCAIGMCRVLGVPLRVMAEALAQVQGVPGRIQSVPGEHHFDVIVDYAHTPDSLENILTAIQEFTTGRIIAIFGCGGDRDPTKRALMGEIAARLADTILITSDNPRTEDPAAILTQVEEGVKQHNKPYELIQDRYEAINRGISMAEPGDTVLIAGKGHEDYQIFKDRTIRFDDMEEAKKALALRIKTNA